MDIAMDFKQKLIDLSREATGDDNITVAGDFQPKGMTWKVVAGAAAGAVLGDAVSRNLGQSISTAAGIGVLVSTTNQRIGDHVAKTIVRSI
jgi:hypothetical protein